MLFRSDANVNAVLAMESVRQSLGNALALVVAGTRPDRVDMSPANQRVQGRQFLTACSQVSLLIFLLRVDLRVAVDF